MPAEGLFFLKRKKEPPDVLRTLRLAEIDASHLCSQELMANRYGILQEFILNKMLLYIE
jgi:hypothetical protein